MPASLCFATLKNFLSAVALPKLGFAIEKQAVPAAVKPKLLVIELWGLGDLAIATPFLRAAAERFEVTLLANPHALEMQPHFWPGVRVIPFVAPWTAFHGKYQLWRWPWRKMFGLRQEVRAEHFEFGLSARWDARDHLLLDFLGVTSRIGFPRFGSGAFLTDLLNAPGITAHRYEFWRAAGKFLGIDLPARKNIPLPKQSSRNVVVIHSGAGQPVRVWPLENYRALVRHLRETGCQVKVLCDAAQLSQWQQFGEANVVSPSTITELLDAFDQAGAFIGNDSGPGHLAAICGVPTFTIFGPQLPECFLPIHPQAEWIEGLPCPYKPCKDYCHFATPHCLWDITEESIWPRVKTFVQSHLARNP
jgi:heptosyltransferase-2